MQDGSALDFGGNFIDDPNPQSGTNQITENYTFDAQTGLMTNQQVKRGTKTTLLDLSYDYTRNNSAGNTNTAWKTGAVTKILNNLDHAKDREYQFDALGRLTKAKGKATNQWTQDYVYDRWGNRTSVTASGTAADGSAIPRDGLASVSYDSATNRITSSASGYQYDLNGNMTRGLSEDGSQWLLYEYDYANRLQLIRRDDANQTMIQAFQFGSSNARLMDYDALGTGRNTFYMNVGGKTMAEFTEYNQNIQTWTKDNLYLGERQFAVVTPNGTTSENTEYHHPDRLGTRLITNQTTGSSTEQVTLPFGTALNAESTVTNNFKRFTSYERSPITGLDYAQNRTYSASQGRFTQVDPIGMAAANLINPQSLNLYSYVGNDPVNRTDPTGLFWGWLKKLFRAILRILIVIAIVVAIAIVATFVPGLLGTILNFAAAAIASLFRFKLFSELIGSIKEWLHKCNVPDYAGLSQARRDELARLGVSPDQWNALRNKQRLGFLNITAAMAALGLSLIGWLVDWASGRGIQQDRVFFKQGPGATNLLAQALSYGSIFSHKSNQSLHGEYSEGFRLRSVFRSTQLSFTPLGDRLEVDIDIGYFGSFPLGFFAHGVEVLTHFLSRLFGGV